MPTALGPFDTCSSAFQPKLPTFSENNVKQDVIFRRGKGGLGNGMQCDLLLLLIILPFLPFVSGLFINVSAQPSKYPQSALDFPSLSYFLPVCIMYPLLQQDRLDQGLPNPSLLFLLLCSHCSSCLEYHPFSFLKIQSLFILEAQPKMWHLHEAFGDHWTFLVLD